MRLSAGSSKFNRKEDVHMKILVALWSRDVYKRTWGYSDDQRLLSLSRAVKMVQDHVPSSISNQPGAIHSIFVAPEYFFSAQRNADTDPRAVSEEAKDKLVVALRALSSLYPKTLLIPGTIAFRKSLVRPQGKEYKADPNTGNRPQDQARLKTTSREAKAERNLKNMLPVMKTTYKGSPEDDKKHGSQILDFKAKIEKINKKAEVIKNQAYVFLNGALKCKYAKKIDVYESVGSDPGVFVPNLKRGVEEIENIKFGFEICGDHGGGIFAALAKSKLAGPPLTSMPDIHIVSSAFIGIEDSKNPAREGGFLLHASSELSHTHVYHKDKAGQIHVDNSPDNNPRSLFKFPVALIEDHDTIDRWIIELV